MRYLSVCSGIEAASVAWEPLGWTPVAFSEVDMETLHNAKRAWRRLPEEAKATWRHIIHTRAGGG